MANGDIFIDSVRFFAIGHHDGRRVRAPGLFAFARRDADGGYTILHFELAEDIARRADIAHGRWAWALAQGMDTLLVHLAGKASSAPSAADLAAAPRVSWSPHAQAPFGEGDEEAEGEDVAV